MDSFPSDQLLLRGRELAVRFCGLTLAFASGFFVIKYLVQTFTPTRIWLLLGTDQWVLLVAMLPAAIATALWSARVRSERDSERLHFVLQYILRVAICPILILYGLSKLMGGQFYPSFLSTLDSTISELDGKDLTWAYYGREYPYAVFMAVPQLLAALFLLSRRTQVLGAALVVAVFGNIVLINFAYDIGTTVKAISVTVLLVGVYLIALDLPRLKTFFLDGRAVAATPHPWPDRARLFLVIHVAFLLAFNLPAAFIAHDRVDKLLHSPTAVHGIWDVTDSAGPLAPGTRVYFDDVRLAWEEHAGAEASTRHGNLRTADRLQSFVYRARADHTIELDLPAKQGTFRGRFSRVGNLLRLDGTIGDRPASIALRRGALRGNPPRL